MTLDRSATDAKYGHLEIVLERAAWTWDGDGLTSDERVLWRSRRALIELVGILIHDEAFAANLNHVRCAPDRRERAWQLARRYGIADRRTLLAALLERGAQHDNLDAAGLAMSNLGAIAVTSRDEPNRTERRNTYLIGVAFLEPIRHGCELLAAKGAGRLLARGEERVVRRTVATILDGVRPSVL